MNTKRVDSVICVWEWVPPKKGVRSVDNREKWKLLKTAVEDDGYVEGVRGQVWVWEQVSTPAGEYWEDTSPILGRLVTCWSMSSGVTLLNFHPPEWSSWVGPVGWEWIQKQREWWSLIEGGWEVRERTAREAERVLKGK